jgi:purine-binding chemotaxis protein CheW
MESVDLQEHAGGSRGGLTTERPVVGSDGQTQYLTFNIAGEEYAVEILQVKEIIEYDMVTRVPSTPAWIRGVINLRGKVVPVIDLAIKFGLAATEVTKWTCIVIAEVELEGEPTVMGMLVDSVSQVIDLPPEEIEQPPSFGNQVRVDYLVGMGKIGSRFALILDIDRVLSATEMLAVASVQTRPIGEPEHEQTLDDSLHDPEQPGNEQAQAEPEAQPDDAEDQKASAEKQRGKRKE